MNINTQLHPNSQGIFSNRKAFSQDQTDPFNERPNLICN